MFWIGRFIFGSKKENEKSNEATKQESIKKKKKLQKRKLSRIGIQKTRRYQIN